jgi:UrcA family protein
MTILGLRGKIDLKEFDMERIVFASLASMAAIALAVPTGAAAASGDAVHYAKPARGLPQPDNYGRVTKSTRVTYTLAELRTTDGVSAFRTRIRHALRQVCTDDEHPDWLSKPERDCRSAGYKLVRPKMEQAIARANSSTSVAMADSAPIVLALSQ